VVTQRKPGRRSNGRGTVSKLPNGKYLARTPYFPDPRTGKPVRTSFTDKTYSAAEARLDDWLRKWDGTPSGAMTVEGLLDQFLIRFEKRVQSLKSPKSPKTLEQYQWAAEHVKPHLGHVAADKLTAVDVETFLAGKESGELNRDGAGKARPLSLRSIKAFRGVLNQAFSEAVRRREVAWNPVSATDPVLVPDARREALTDRQVAALLEVARREQEGRYYALIRLGLDLGLRPGELLGLRWTDWLREERVLRIKRSVTKEAGKPVVGGLKSDTSYATLPLSDELAGVLNSHEQWLATKLGAAGIDNPDHWIFPSTSGGFIHPDNLRHSIARLGDKAGIDGLTPDLFRHTASTDMTRARMDPSHRRRIMRHSRLSTTEQYYTHLGHEDLRADLEKLASRHGSAT